MNKRGFTVFEILIAILIFSLIAGAMGMAVVSGQRSLFTTDVPTQLRQNLLFAILSVGRELRQTAPSRTDLPVGVTNNSITFQIPNDNDADGVTVDAVGNIEWGTTITYSLNGANQLIRTQNGIDSVVSSNIATLQFSRPAGDNIIQVDITAQRANGTGSWTDTEQARIKMRN